MNINDLYTTALLQFIEKIITERENALVVEIGAGGPVSTKDPQSLLIFSWVEMKLQLQQQKRIINKKP